MPDDSSIPPREATPPQPVIPILGYATPGSTRLVTIHTYGDSFEANLALNRLQAEGIQAFLLDENMVATGGGLYTGLVGGIRLQVPEPDVERALSLLPKERKPGPLTCPKCGSTDVLCSHFLGSRIFLVLLFLGMPLLFTEPPCQCRACGHLWQGREDREEEEDESV